MKMKNEETDSVKFTPDSEWCVNTGPIWHPWPLVTVTVGNYKLQCASSQRWATSRKQVMKRSNSRGQKKVRSKPIENQLGDCLPNTPAPGDFLLVAT